jgi:hypothetical protein
MTTKQAPFHYYYLRRESVRLIALEQTFPTAHKAYQAIGQAIYDNGYGTKIQAQKFAATVPIDGTPIKFGPYTFTLTEALPCHWLTIDGEFCGKQSTDGHCSSHQTTHI